MRDGKSNQSKSRRRRLFLFLYNSQEARRDERTRRDGCHIRVSIPHGVNEGNQRFSPSRRTHTPPVFLFLSIASPLLAEIDAFQHTTHIQTPTLWDTRRERVTSTERNQRKRTTTERSNEKIKRATWGFTTRGHLQWRKRDWTRHRRYLSIAYHSRVDRRRTGPAAIGDSISIAHLSPGQIQLCLGALWWTDHTETRRKRKKE